MRGVEPTSAEVANANRLGICTLLAAWFGAIPAIVHLVHQLGDTGAPGIPIWVHAVFLIAGIESAYALYVVQLPDWSTVRVVGLAALVLAAAYALFAGVSVLADEQNRLVRWFGLADRVYGHTVTGWCLVMLTVNGLLAYCAGQWSLRWQRTSGRNTQ